MTGKEYEKYQDIFPEIREKKNWKFDGAFSIPHWTYIGPSIEELKREESKYEI